MKQRAPLGRLKKALRKRQPTLRLAKDMDMLVRFEERKQPFSPLFHPLCSLSLFLFVCAPVHWARGPWLTVTVTEL